MKTKVTEVRLESAPLCNTPGVLTWAINGYKFKRDRNNLIRVLVEGYNLTRRVAKGLLDGTIPHKVEGDAVVFTVEGEYRRSS